MQFRHLLRFVIEAASPLTVGSGNKDFVTDAPVIKDVNGLPFIPGTSLAGVIRHALGESKSKDFFGFNDPKDSNNGHGSKVIFTNAIMIGNDGNVIDGLVPINFEDQFYSMFKILPIRQHNSINEKGTVKNAGKFDEQVVYKGTRFCFEIELISSTENEEIIQLLIDTMFSSQLRIGGGTRTGFGEIEVITCKYCVLDLAKQQELITYSGKSSSLNDNQFWGGIKLVERKKEQNKGSYLLELKPDDFFLFGAGFGNENADMSSVRESIIKWSDKNIPFFDNEYILIPATSIKGAISHRVAYHFNRLESVYADTLKIEDFKLHVGSKNKAVKALFGTDGNKTDESQERGNVLLSDLFIDPKSIAPKILNHIAIDRFTGGAIDGALFQEEVIYGNNIDLKLNIQIHKNFTNEPKIIEALESTLDDICNGMLPLGGGVNRGHGSFSGKYTKH